MSVENLTKLQSPAFIPVQGKEELIKIRYPEAKNGYVYFATDTKKIYCGKNGEYIPMGGNSGIYYGKRQLKEDEKYNEDIIDFIFIIPDDIDGDQVPVVNDLILNEPDGSFYRVTKIDAQGVHTSRLAVAGGSGSSGNLNEGTLKISIPSGTLQKDQVLAGRPYTIYYEIEAKDAAGDAILAPGVGTWIINGETYTQTVYNGSNSFSITDYLKPNEEITCSLTVQMNTGGLKDSFTTKQWFITQVNFKLDWNRTYSYENFINRSTSNTFGIQFKPWGNVECEAHLIFDNDPSAENHLVKTITAEEASGMNFTWNNIPNRSYGAHTAELYLTAMINGNLERTDSVFHEITFYGDDTAPILTVPFYQKTATQYDTLNIPFIAYDPSNAECEVEFYVNDSTEPIVEKYNTSLQSWAYTITTYGLLKLEMRIGDNCVKTIELVVDELKLPIKEETDYVFSLKAMNFSSNTELRNWRVTGPDDNDIYLEFSDNFDWINGGLQFETQGDSIEKFINIRQGTRMTVKYKPFQNFNTNLETGGKNIKFCFKAVNCYDYEAQVLECIDNRVGLSFNAQQAIFKTPAAPNFSTQYFENSYVEVETEIWPPKADEKIGTEGTIWGDRFLMFWVDGVPTGIKYYSQNEDFTQTTAQDIVIGSDECDVHVYVLKVHDRRLSPDEHLNNFILDAPSSQKLIERYRRNDILENGEISYEKLVKANPQCHAYLYEIPYMTSSKDDKDDVNLQKCKYIELYGDNNTLTNPYYSADNTSVYVQGTSSAAYGVSAFNIRSKFKKGLVDKDGNKVDGWKVSEDAIPINLACTKVNVASCENANNVVNQEWYNKFQPYHDAHRRKSEEHNKKYRDTMEFNSGVVFIKDNNKKIDYLKEGKPDETEYFKSNIFLDTPDYIKNPYFKLYAIGNMGNDKKNVEVFHDTTNPKACCVEVKDNQNEQHWMTVPIGMDNFDMKDPYHEFRYPDGNKDANNEQKQAYIDFVQWMCDMNPNGGNDAHILKAKEIILTENNYQKNKYYIKDNNGNYYKSTEAFNSAKQYYEIYGAEQKEGDTLINVLFDSYTYKGFDPPGYEGSESPTGVSLKGFTETKYSTTKQIETIAVDGDGNPILKEDGSYQMQTEIVIRPYTHDTKDFRMARMLSECEDHLVMDSVVYHYLYITRHTMVDNVAKNTFWSTEDLIHWDLTKDYDNDTSDGNDNSGYLSYSYGLEFGDQNIDGKQVFNASPSVWIQFISGLDNTQEELYRILANTKYAWDPTGYLAEFKKHQDIIPERCWIQDYFRKYIRPRQLGIEEEKYLIKLEGGKKTHQRTQFENYQNFYYNSKYGAGEGFKSESGNVLDFRLNQDPNSNWNTENVLNISFYTDCYARILLGGQRYVSERLKRGSIDKLPIGKMVGAPSDATCYIYGGNMVQSLSGLDKIYPSYCSFGSANKLRYLEIGSSEPDYYNDYLTSVGLSENTMLQKLQLRNCGNRLKKIKVLLPNTKQLKELYLSGSATSELELAEGATVETLELNPLTTLTAYKLSNLTNITVDEDDPDTSEIIEPSIYSSIQNVYVKDCPRLDPYTYKFAKCNSLERYLLTGFNWTITSLDDLISNGETGSDKKFIDIMALNNLTDGTTLPKLGSTTQAALSGTITVDVNGTIDEFVIYNKYAETFPNLTINYTNNVVDLIPAVKLIFKTNETESADIHYKVLGNNSASATDTITKLISDEGPLKTAIKTPSKQNTTSHTYTFTGYWIEKIGENKTYYYIPGTIAEGDIRPGAISFDFIPTRDMEFYPEFIQEDRKYSVRFFDFDGSLIYQEDADGKNQLDSWPVIYGHKYDGPIKNFYYRDSSDLTNANLRWTFKGWSIYNYGDTEVRDPVYTDPLNLIVTESISLFAHYIKEDCLAVASSNEYFNFTEVTLFEQNGYRIDVRDNYKNILKGKITIPAKYQERNVIQIGDFRNTNGITHLFCQSGSQYLVVGENEHNRTASSNYGFYCENQGSQLVKVVLSETIIDIGNFAFMNCGYLKDINLPDTIEYLGSLSFAVPLDGALQPFSSMQVKIESLPSNLKTIASYAFYFGGNNITFADLPKSLESIGEWSIASCPNVRIENFGTGPQSASLTLHNCILYKSGVNVKTITIGDNVVSLAYDTGITDGSSIPQGFSGSFVGYGSSTGGTVTITRGYEAYGLIGINQLGFDPTIWQH